MPFAHKHLPHYTYEDYSQWKGEWELIDGIPYAMSPAPAPNHQRINGKLFSRFDAALTEKCEKCKVYTPIDWKISEDTVVQPDLLVVCNEIEKNYLDFLPALVAEIISPSSAFYDRNTKKEIYLSQKVKYYLIVDPKFRKTEIYQFIDGDYVPVSVSPDTFSFTFEDDCTVEVNIADIWD